MGNIERIKRLVDKERLLLEQRYKVKFIGIFGSYVRGDTHKGSDIDILVEFSKPIDLFEFIRLEESLGQILSAKVDLVTTNALKPLIKDNILKEVVYI